MERHANVTIATPAGTAREYGRAHVERRRAEILASGDARFPPDPEHYDALYVRYAPVVGDGDAAALAQAVALLGCAPVLPDYEIANAIERLFAMAAAE